MLLVWAGCFGASKILNKPNEIRLAEEINALRLSSGTPALKYDPTLAYVARKQSESQAACRKVSHFDCMVEHQSFTRRIRTYCPSAMAAAENVGACTHADNWRGMFALWNESTPHRMAMTSTSYTSFGVARRCSEPAYHRIGLCYWTAVFAAPPRACAEAWISANASHHTGVGAALGSLNVVLLVLMFVSLMALC